MKGFLNLTNKEVEILAAFVDAQAALDARGIAINAFTPEVKKIVAKKLGIAPYHKLNIYIKALKDKSVLIKTESGYKVNVIASNRDSELTIKFL
ncbi:MAG: hypothetical protein E4G89_04290 [Methanothrix sp.]|nr:MAG: hypothetical protein E4G89_04290 [Methanothrix sp.]